MYLFVCLLLAFQTSEVGDRQPCSDINVLCVYVVFVNITELMRMTGV